MTLGWRSGRIAAGLSGLVLGFTLLNGQPGKPAGPTDPDPTLRDSAGTQAAHIAPKPESDVPLTNATWALTLATVIIVVTNLLLYRITSKHVEHTAKLVATIERIQTTNTLPLLAASLTTTSVGISLAFKNIGRVAVRLQGASLQITGRNGKEQVFELSDYHGLWFAPSEQCVVDNLAVLSRVWPDGIKKITASWTFNDGTSAEAALTPNIETWVFDHNKHIIHRQG